MSCGEREEKKKKREMSLGIGRGMAERNEMPRFRKAVFFFEDRTNQMLRQVRTMKERFVDLNRVS